MTTRAQKPTSLDLASFAVFSTPGTQPVAVLNESSSQHGRLLYCDRAVANLAMIASVCEGHENIDVQYLAGMFSNQLEPLSKVLARLVSDCETLARGQALPNDQMQGGAL